MKTLMTTIALAIAATSASADMIPDGVSIPLYVEHVNYQYDDWNQGFANNLGVLLEWEVTETIDFTAGLYNNSFAELSTTAFVTWSPIYGDNWSLGVLAGFATYDLETTPLDMPSRLGETDFIAIGAVRAQYESIYATYTPTGPDGLAIITAGVQFDF